MSIRKLADGRYEWRHRVGGRHLKKTFTRRADAVSHDAAVRADAARGVLVDISNKTTVAQYARQWSEARVLRPGSRRVHESFLRNHLDSTPLGGRPVVKVRPSEVSAWIAGRAATLGPVALAKTVVMLRSIFAAAVLDGVCARNPVLPGPRLALPRPDRPKFVPLTVGQVRAWAGHADARVEAAIITQAATGLRISELRGLRLGDVDFLRRTVSIDSQLGPAGRRAPLKTSRRQADDPAACRRGRCARCPPGRVWPRAGWSQLHRCARPPVGAPGCCGSSTTPRQRRPGCPLALPAMICATITPASCWRPVRAFTRSRNGWETPRRWSCRSMGTSCPTWKTAPGARLTRPGSRNTGRLAARPGENVPYVCPACKFAQAGRLLTTRTFLPAPVPPPAPVLLS